MAGFLRRQSAEREETPEAIKQVSSDLPYELQSKVFDQLATMGIPRAGLSVTLIGSLIRDAPASSGTAVG